LIWLRIALLSVHLILMNFASAAPLVAVWLDSRASRLESQRLHRFGRTIGWLSLIALGVGITVGLLQGWLLWNREQTAYFQAIEKLWDSKIVFGIWEIVFSVVFMAAYLLWWKFLPRKAFWQRVVSRLLAVFAATNLLYHFPTLFVIAGMLSRGELSAEGDIDSGMFRQFLMQPKVIWFTVHFWLASVAVSAQITGWRAVVCLNDEDEQQGTSGRAFAVALFPTLAQAAIGFFYLLSLPKDQISQLMGRDPMTSVVFVASLGMALWLMQSQVALASFHRTSSRSVKSLAILVGTIFLMTASMLLSRLGIGQ